MGQRPCSCSRKKSPADSDHYEELFNRYAFLGISRIFKPRISDVGIGLLVSAIVQFSYILFLAEVYCPRGHFWDSMAGYFLLAAIGFAMAFFSGWIATYLILYLKRAYRQKIFRSKIANLIEVRNNFSSLK